MKKLLAYVLDGSILGINLTSWNSSDLNGMVPFKIIEELDDVDSNYADISSVKNWDAFGLNLTNDYLSLKSEIKSLVISQTWSNLSDEEKYIAIKYYAYTSSVSAIVFLMSKGMTMQEAQVYLTQEWHKHHYKLLESCRQRWYYVKLIVATYLPFNDAENLFDTARELIYSFTESSRIGINYGDKKSGLMDYVESTNSYVGNGLKESGFTLQYGTWDEFIIAIKNVIVYGNYSKY